MNEDPLEQQDEERVNFSESRVSTNDSNDIQDDIDEFPDLTSRELRFEDMDQEALQSVRPPPSPFQKRTTQSLGSRVLECARSGCIRASSICLVTVYHLFTTLIILTEVLLLISILLLYVTGLLDLNLAIWFFMALSMIFVILKMCLTHFFPETNDVSNLLQFTSQSQDVLSLRQGGQQAVAERGGRALIRRRERRNGSPQSMNQRRLAGEYQRRVHAHAQRRNQEVELGELHSTLSRHHSLSRDNAPNLRLNFQSGVTLGEMRRRREQMIRNELLRSLLTRVSMDRGSQRGLNNHLILLRANLQMLQLQAMGRDFNENDYDVLSQLDTYQTRQATERIQCIISQLPTYSYQLKGGQSSSQPSRDQDEPHQESGSDEKLRLEKSHQEFDDAGTCTICIEAFCGEDMIKILPCFHQFHARCVDDWLLRKSVCPVCKFDIDVNEDSFYERSEAVGSSQQR